MLKKLLSIMLVTILVNLVGIQVAYAESKEQKQAKFAEKVKTNILKLGTGEATRVKVKLCDETKFEGFISSANENTFTVTNAKTGVATAIDYSQVKSVKGNNLSTGAKIAIGAGIAAAVILIILWRVVVDQD